MTSRRGSRNRSLLKALSPLTGVLLISLVILAGCGKKTEQVTSKAPETVVAESDRDVSSGCWSAADRMKPGSEGSDTPAHAQWTKQPNMVIDAAKSYTAVIETNYGTISVALDPAAAPIAVNNFVCLAKSGYFDNTPMHRIVQDFVVQGGDPTGTGIGGPGYRFPDEVVTKDYVKGALAMANAGPNTNGSQFFICTADLSGRLPKNYTIFGQVTGGMDVVDTLNKVETAVGPSGEKSSPTAPVTITTVTVTES